MNTETIRNGEIHFAAIIQLKMYCKSELEQHQILNRNI